MPTETKNSTANASCSGSASAAARWLSSDSLTTAPATNAPSANDMPNSCDAIVPTPSAIASTVSVNSSREPSRATCARSHGTTRRPTTNIRRRNATTLPIASAIEPARPPAESGCPPGGRRAAERHGDGGQQHQHQHHREVFDDEPPDGEAPLARVEPVARLEPLEHDDRAGDGERQAEHHGAAHRQPPPAPEPWCPPCR